MKKVLKCIGIVLLIVIIVGILFMRFGMTIFWKLHDVASENLQVTLREGVNDLEYQYGQDEDGTVGSLQVERATDDITYTIFYPLALSESYPVVVWGNGTGNTYENYEPALRSLASYGFIVIGCDDSNMGGGETLYAMGLYARDLATDEDSLFYEHVDVDHIGVAGHSQGACGAVNAATKFEESATLFASVFTTSLPKLSMCVDSEESKFAYWAYDVSEIAVPYFATTGTRFLDSLWISPLEDMEESFAALDDDIVAVAARQKHANHNIINEYHASGYFNAWFCYTLKDDSTAKEAFSDEIEQNTFRWKDVLKQNI